MPKICTIESCPRYREILHNPCIKGSGPCPAKIMIVGDTVTEADDRHGLNFSGPLGNTLDSVLGDVGLRREDVYITNATKCFTHKSDIKPSQKELKCCKCFLDDEIKAVNPNVIIALGATAMKVLIKQDKITKLKNQVYISEEYGVKVVPTYHPNFINRNPHEYVNVYNGFKLAVAEASAKEVQQKKKITGQYLVVDTEENIDKVLTKLESLDHFVIDLETTSLNCLVAKIICVSLSWKIGSGVVIPWECLKNGLLERFKKILVSDKLKIGQNIKYDIEVFLGNKIPIKGPFYDIMLAHGLLDENSRHGLDDMVLRYTDMGDYWTVIEKERERVAKEKKIPKEDVSYDMIPRTVLLPYAAKDGDATYRLYNIFDKNLERVNLKDFYVKHPLEFMPVIIQMEFRGVKIDRERLAQLIETQKEKIVEAERILYEDPAVKNYEGKRMLSQIAKLRSKYEESKSIKSRYPNGYEEYTQTALKEKDWKFNFKSTKQLRELFFTHMGLASVKETDKGADSTDVEVMEYLAGLGVVIAKKLVEFRKLSKALSTYMEPIYEKSALDGRIHTSYNQTVAVSGRLSSSGPNLQNIPRDALEFKDCFIADPGFLFVKSDLAQAEFRCWATYADDEDMIADIKAVDLKLKPDIHKQSASDVYNIPVDQVTKEQRNVAKAVTFGLMYGRGSKAVADQFGISVEQANAVKESFLSRYPKATAWLDSIVREARAYKCVKSFFGRIRHLPNIDNPDKYIRAEAERQAMNSPIQAQAADMNNAYLVNILKRARAAKIQCFPALTIHDDNTLICKKEQIKDLICIMKDVVANTFPEFKCPMMLEIKVGERLGSCIDEDKYFAQLEKETNGD